MIKVLVGSSTERKSVVIPPTQTLKQTLDQSGVDYSTSQVYLDGATLGPGELDKTFNDFNIKEKCMLVAVVKLSNA